MMNLLATDSNKCKSVKCLQDFNEQSLQSKWVIFDIIMSHFGRRRPQDHTDDNLTSQ